MQMKLDLQLAGRMALLSGHNIGEILKTQRHVNARNGVGYVRKKSQTFHQNGTLLHICGPLTLILLTWRKWWTPNNASKWQMGFNSAFKGLNTYSLSVLWVKPCSEKNCDMETHGDETCILFFRSLTGWFGSIRSRRVYLHHASAGTASGSQTVSTRPTLLLAYEGRCDPSQVLFQG